MSEHDWKYVRTNSKGESVFRKDTNESLEFVTNYLNKYADEQMTYYEDEHIACYSYPNCDISPSGCIVISGDNVERYGHRD